MRVLLAEDDTKLGKLTKYMLEQNKISAEWIQRGDEIYDFAMYNDEYDVLILDWMLPGESGVEACRKLRKAGYQKAVLLLTARDSIEDRVTGLDAGADDSAELLFSQAECRTADHAGGHHSAVHLRGGNIGRAEQLLCPRAQLGYDAAHPQRLSVRGHRVRAGRSAQRKRAFFL